MKKLATLFRVKEEQLRPFLVLGLFLAALYVFSYAAQLFILYYPKYSGVDVLNIFDSERLTRRFFYTILLTAFFAGLIFLTTVLYSNFQKASLKIKAALIIWSTLLLSFIFYRLPVLGMGRCSNLRHCYSPLSAAQAPLNNFFNSSILFIILATTLIFPFIYFEVKSRTKKSMPNLLLPMLAGPAMGIFIQFLDSFGFRIMDFLIQLMEYLFFLGILFFLLFPLLLSASKSKSSFQDIFLWILVFLTYLYSIGLLGFFLLLFTFLGAKELFSHPVTVALILFYPFLAIKWPRWWKQMI